MQVQPWSARRPEPKDNRSVGVFGGSLAREVLASAPHEGLRSFAFHMRDKSYALSFEKGYGEGRWDGAFEALEEYVEGYRHSATVILGFYEAVYDPVLWVKGLGWWLSARGSTEQRLAQREIQARLDTYEWFRSLEDVVPLLPALVEATLEALREPGELIGELLTQSLGALEHDFVSANGRPREQGYALGRFVGRGITELCLTWLELLPLGTAAASAISKVPKLVSGVRQAVRRLPKTRKRPPRAFNLLDEARRDADVAAAARLAESTPSGGVAGSGPSAQLNRFVRAAEAGLPPQLEGLPRERWAELWSYTRIHWRSPAAVKGAVAEHMIDRNEKFTRAVEGLRRKLVGDRQWDVATLQYVRRVAGKAPTRTTAGAFRDLADGMIVVRSRDPAARPQLRILAVFESKSPSNVGDLVSTGAGDIGQIGWDFERISENPLQITVQDALGGRVQLLLDPEDVVVSRYTTKWVAVTPKGSPLSPQEFTRLKASIPGLEEWSHPLPDSELNKIADKLVKLVEPQPSVPKRRR